MYLAVLFIVKVYNLSRKEGNVTQPNIKGAPVAIPKKINGTT